RRAPCPTSSSARSTGSRRGGSIGWWPTSRAPTCPRSRRPRDRRAVTPSAAELRAIGDADVPPYRRVRALLEAHGLPHGRRARRRFYEEIGAQVRVVNRPFLPLPVRALLGVRRLPGWYLRWLAIERPWRRPERWRCR